MTDQDLTPEQALPIQMLRRRPAPAGFILDREARKIGGILERGRNANGEYEIYSSGVVWCRDKDKREWIGLRVDWASPALKKGPPND